MLMRVTCPKYIEQAVDVILSAEMQGLKLPTAFAAILYGFRSDDIDCCHCRLPPLKPSEKCGF